MEFGGYRYENEIDEDDDVSKISHAAVNVSTGERHSIPFSPYKRMTAESFSTWVAMGLPSPSGFTHGGNFTNEALTSIRETVESTGIDISDLSAVKAVYRITR